MTKREQKLRAELRAKLDALKATKDVLSAVCIDLAIELRKARKPARRAA